MSLDDVYRDRYYSPGYVYVAGSLSGRVLKIGTTKDVWGQQYRLQYVQYGSLGDWRMLCYVRVDEAGNVEHAVRRRLQRYKTMRMYVKDGFRQIGREIVQCSFSTAFKAFSDVIGDEQKSKLWQSKHCHYYEFG
jgi:hypothetical protein